MTFYRTCTGCEKQGQPCETRDALRAAIKGLCITSIKWKCADRTPRFKVGDPVWARTVAGGDQYHDSDEGPIWDDFPGHIVKDYGNTLIVYIADQAPGKEFGGEDIPVTFQPRSNGFCKIPLSRLKEREGERVEICRSCELPAPYGHRSGYSCHYQGPEFDPDDFV